MKSVNFKRIGKDRKALTKILKEASYKDRVLAADYLGDLGDQEAVADLVEALDDKVVPVVNSAIIALRKIGTNEEIEDLIMERLTALAAEENKINTRKEQNWQPTSEEEKREQLQRYAAETHIRAARKEELNIDRGKTKNWLMVSVILLTIWLLFHFFGHVLL